MGSLDPLGAQEPVFVTPPVTMYQRGLLAGAQLERRAGVSTAALETAFGVMPPLTLSVGALGTDGAGGSMQLARAHVGARLRLLKRDRPAEWLLLSVYGLGALPLGGAPARVSESLGVADLVVGLSAARMARAGDVFADLSLSSIPSPGESRLRGGAGLAVGWRPSPQDYGRAEIQLFAEARGLYSEGGSAAMGVAPGILIHSRAALAKVGVLLPLWERRSAGGPSLLLAFKFLR